MVFSPRWRSMALRVPVFAVHPGIIEIGCAVAGVEDKLPILGIRHRVLGNIKTPQRDPVGRTFGRRPALTSYALPARRDTDEKATICWIEQVTHADPLMS